MFTLSQAAKAAGAPVTTVRSWFGRGIVGLGPDDHDAEFAGDTTRVSHHTVLAIAITNALARIGVPLPRAAHAANTFAHTNAGIPMRGRAGSLYPGPGVVGTILTVSPTGTVRITRMDGRTTALEMLALAGESGAAILLVDPIVRRVSSALEE